MWMKIPKCVNKTCFFKIPKFFVDTLYYECI